MPSQAQPAAAYSLFDPTPDSDVRDMDTDRPNVVNTPNTLDAGHVQIETGLVDFTREWSDTSSNAVATGEVNVRLGVLANLEMNVATTLFKDGPAGYGVGDTSVGGKLNIWGDAGSNNIWATALAVQPQVKLATSGSRLGNGHVEAAINLPFSINLPGAFRLGLQLTPELARDEHNTAYVAGIQPAVSIARVLVANADVYLEYRAEVVGRSRCQETIDVGFTRPIGKNIVIDGGVFFGLTRASNSFEYVAGVSVRF